MKCKLIGSFVKHLEVELAQGESFYSERRSLIYSDAAIDTGTEMIGNSLGKILGAVVGGESLILLRHQNLSPMPAKLTVGAGSGLIHFKLTGEQLICRRGAYVASTAKVDITLRLSIAGLMGGMQSLLQRISGNATVFLACVGDPVIVDLQPGQTIKVDEDHFLATVGIPESRMSAQWGFRSKIAGEGWSMIHITGPGRVYLNPGMQFLRKEDVR